MEGTGHISGRLVVHNYDDFAERVPGDADSNVLSGFPNHLTEFPCACAILLCIIVEFFDSTLKK